MAPEMPIRTRSREGAVDDPARNGRLGAVYGQAAAATSQASIASTSSAPPAMQQQEAPYLTHLVRHHARACVHDSLLTHIELTLTSPSNLGRARRPEPQARAAKPKKAKRAAAGHEIMHAVANVGLPPSGALIPSASSPSLLNPQRPALNSTSSAPVGLRPPPMTSDRPASAQSRRRADEPRSTPSSPARTRTPLPVAPTRAPPQPPTPSEHEHAEGPSQAEASNAALRRSIWDGESL